MKSLLVKIIHLFNSFILRIKVKRRINEKRDFINLNIGCGLTVYKNWINIDGSLNCIVANLPKIFKKLTYRFSGVYYNENYNLDSYIKILSENEFLHHDLSKSIPFHDNTVSNVFSSHFLEHLKPEDGIKLLKEIYRSLKIGGRLRLSIPDLTYAISLYPKEKDKMLNQYFFINHGNEYSSHKYMYDYEMLHDICTKIGFIKISRSVYKNSNFLDCEKLDNREVDSLFIEAYK